MTSTTVSHPLFGRCFHRLSWLIERDAAPHRRQMLAGASGRVVEIGARVQTWLDRSGVWPRLGGGCHCARDTVDAIEAAGFRVERLEHVTVGPGWVVTNPYVVGVAT